MSSIETSISEKTTEYFIVFKFLATIQHPYLRNRKKTEKIINEINISPDIKQMFELIEKRKSKPREITTEPIEVLELI